MKLLTIDQSFTHTAWILWEDQEVIDFDVIKTDKSKTNFERAIHISREISMIVNRVEVDEIVIERMSFGSIGNATRNLAGLFFVIVCDLMRATPFDIDKLQIVSPTSAKKALTGSGGKEIKKQQMIEALPEDVRLKFQEAGFKKTTGLSDLADAYSFGVWFYKS